MAKYIDADTVDKIIRKKIEVTKEFIIRNALIDIEFEIEDLPAADVEPVRHGEWLRTGEEDIEFQCGVCGRFISSFSEPEYCPHCGAKMDGGKKND